MKRIISRLLRRWGNTLHMVTETGVTDLQGMLQPTRSKSLANMRRAVGMDGALPRGQFLYLGETDLSPAEYLLQGEEAYVVRSCEAVSAADEVLFYWALLQKTGEEELWNT